MILLKNLTLSRAHKVLLQAVNVALYEKQKIGLTGRNGCGKSSLFALLLGHLQPDAGECFINAQLRISYLSQQLPETEEEALQFVLAGDEAYLALNQQLAKAEQQGDDAAVLACHAQMEQSHAYRKPSQACAIMAGLGFQAEEQHRPVSSFSGGWRMRLNLARCLMKPADLLLLDEPTNHLDMEAIIWLEKWLKQTPAAVIVISHDREFLDAITTHILYIEQQHMTLYTGNFSRFEQTRAQQLQLQQATHEKQQKQVAHLMSFVTRFKAKATKAKQAQSRLKAIERMVMVAAAHIDSPFSFEFHTSQRVANPLIQCQQLSAGYDAAAPILHRINMTLNAGDRVALLGPNGQGKSTFIKTLTGSLPPLAGSLHHSANLSIGYYAQHQLEDLNPAWSPIQTIQALSPSVSEQVIRDFLGGFQFFGDMAASHMHHFSGGEKARLALAKLVWQKPNLLLLDEPTNHLDLDMRSAIELALQSYEGALVIISHDRHLLNTVADAFYLVYDGQVVSFEGDLEDYQQWLLSKPTVKTQEALQKSFDYRDRKQLQNRLKTLEKQIVDYQKQLKTIEQALGEDSLYETSAQGKLQELLKTQKNKQELLAQAEEEWLDVAQQLE